MKETQARYFIVAWLPPEEEVKRVVMDSEGEKVLHFGTYEEAWDFYVDNMTPDWEAIVISMATVHMNTIEEAAKVIGKAAMEIVNGKETN